jgi:hypothetical protein
MKMKTLLVCHDTGNTRFLLDTANRLLAKDQTQEITFLIVGEAAKSIFSHADNQTH